MSIKYYHLVKDEEPPEEFCAIRDMGGEPREYVFYVPETENDKLRKLCVKALEWLRWAGGITCPPEVPDEFADELRELGIEVDE